MYIYFVQGGTAKMTTLKVYPILYVHTQLLIFFKTSKFKVRYVFVCFSAYYLFPYVLTF